MCYIGDLTQDHVVCTAVLRGASGVSCKEVLSHAMPEILSDRLEREGAWSVRWIHSVYKSDTGKRGLCEYLGALPADEKQKMMDLYRNRPKPRR